MRSTAHGLLILAVCFFIPAAAAASESDALPFRLTPQGAIIVPVAINGSRPVSFLLDTGSNGSVVSERLAASLGLRAAAKTTMVSASEQKEALVARIEHLTLGTVGASDVLAALAPAEALSLPDTAALGCRVEGVIGQDVLGRLRYTIDYRARRIHWRASSADPPRRASRFALEPQDDRFLIRLPQEHRELRLVPDTGSEALVLFQPAETIAERARTDPAVALTGLAGTRSAWRAVVRKLHVGDTILTELPAVVVDSKAGPTTVDGLLPLHFFARVTFDGPERQLFIEPR